MAEIRCLRPQADLSVVSGVLLPPNIKTVKIEGCPLPNSSLSEFLDSIKVHSYVWLYLTSYNGSLSRKHFEDLDKIRILNISLNDLGDFSVDIFEELTNLKELTIHFSPFSIKKGIFRSNTKPAWASDSIQF